MDVVKVWMLFKMKKFCDGRANAGNEVLNLDSEWFKSTTGRFMGTWPIRAQKIAYDIYSAFSAIYSRN